MSASTGESVSISVTTVDTWLASTAFTVLKSWCSESSCFPGAIVSAAMPRSRSMCAFTPAIMCCTMIGAGSDGMTDIVAVPSATPQSENSEPLALDRHGDGGEDQADEDHQQRRFGKVRIQHQEHPAEEIRRAVLASSVEDVHPTHGAE